MQTVNLYECDKCESGFVWLGNSGKAYQRFEASTTHLIIMKLSAQCITYAAVYEKGIGDVIYISKKCVYWGCG